MTRPRVEPELESWTTASPQGSGCSSGLLIPPLAVLLVSGLLALFAYSPFVTVSASPISPAIADAPAPASTILNSDYAQSGLSPIFTPEVQYWGSRIVAWSAEFGLDPNLAATVMQIESCGFARATSRSGAMGLFQVMPFHFSTTDSPYDPDTNARRGLGYLAQSLQRAGGDARLALAGYNGGIGVIGRGEWTWSAQTNRYVYYGAPIYADASAGLGTSAMLNEWYLSYGVSLCQQAHEYLGLP
ncbi:MAG: transglycosylase SLT domain-containing protein [Chloroflexota bacterium]